MSRNADPFHLQTMSSMTFSQKKFVPSAPEKGSFPLDHEGQCKRVMIQYMTCLQQNQDNNTLCREDAKAYLACRMENNLMAKEEWTKLGYEKKEEESNH